MIVHFYLFFAIRIRTSARNITGITTPTNERISSHTQIAVATFVDRIRKMLNDEKEHMRTGNEAEEFADAR